MPRSCKGESVGESSSGGSGGGGSSGGGSGGGGVSVFTRDISTMLYLFLSAH